MTTKQNKNRPSNFVILTVQAVKPSEGVRLTPNGDCLVKARTFKSMGKTKDGETYKPSLFVDIQHWNEGDAPDAVAEFIGTISKGDLVTVKGQLAYEEWTDADGNTRQSMSIWVNEIEPFVYDNDASVGSAAVAEENNFI